MPYTDGTSYTGYKEGKNNTRKKWMVDTMVEGRNKEREGRIRGQAGKKGKRYKKEGRNEIRKSGGMKEA